MTAQHPFHHVWPQLIWVGVCALAATTAAHEGPPFPILMDQPLAGRLVSIWADPDIGEAEFFVVVESPEGGIPAQAPRVSMWFEPTSGRLQRVECKAVRQPLRNRMQFHAEPYFDVRDIWRVGFRLEFADAEASANDELVTEVESTPDGFGAWDVAIYLFPFLLLGGMWVLALLRRRRTYQPARNAPDSSTSHSHADLQQRRLELP